MSDTLKELQKSIKSDIINNILLASSILAIFAETTAVIRSEGIGWELRDNIQLTTSILLITLALFRKNLSTEIKASFVIAFYILGGISGFFSLGMLGGTVFLFPTAIVVIAVFYKRRFTWIFITVFLSLFSVVAFRFCSNRAYDVSSSAKLMTTYSHWVVYIVCVGFFFIVAAIAIHSYRKYIMNLLSKIYNQSKELEIKNRELLELNRDVKVLSGLVPICSCCKKIRDDKGYWNQLETYLRKYSKVEFSHGICPECLKKEYPESYERIKDDLDINH